MSMQELLHLVASLEDAVDHTEDKKALRQFGFISCAHTVRLKRAPFYEPCLIVVLAGRKVIFDRDGPVIAKLGDVLTVPGPASFDIRNEPEARNKKYRALIIPFSHELLGSVARIYHLESDPQQDAVVTLKFSGDDLLLSAIKHYLSSPDDAKLTLHRLMEILLILMKRNPVLFSYVLQVAHWSQKVRAILSTDLTRSWEIETVCELLATTESTLRRHLKSEKTGFRDLLSELRLATALIMLLQTAHSIHRIALDCGYQSVSRFSHNFHKRFGAPPTVLRESMSVSE